MLKEHFGSYEAFPHEIQARLLQADVEVLADSSVAEVATGQIVGSTGIYCNYKRLRYLSHLPLGCSITLCEVDLKRIVSKKIMTKYDSDLRRKSRMRQIRIRRDEKNNKLALRSGHSQVQNMLQQNGMAARNLRNCKIQKAFLSWSQAQN